MAEGMNLVEKSLEERERDITCAICQDPPTKKCVVHEEPLTLYCFDCDSLICRDCIVKDHRDHNFEFSKIAAPNTKTKLLEKLEPLTEVKVSLSHALEEIQTTKHELEAQGDSVAITIKTSFQELHEILEKRKRELLKEAGRRVQEKVSKLSLQEKNLSLASIEVQSVLEYTKQCVKHCGDNEVMNIHAEIRRKIEQEIEEHGKSGRNLDPVKEVDIGLELKCAEALEKLCQTKAKITRLPIDPAKSTVIVEGAITPEVDKVTEAPCTVIKRLSNNKLTKRICEVDCHLKSLINRSVTRCNADLTGPSKYSIQMKPSIRGRHQLTVSMNGEQVAGSPFPVCVSIPPTELGKPLHVWGGISKPTGITVNSVGEIIVIELDGHIIWFSKDGKRLRSVKHKLNLLYGVAVDSDDNVYCTDLQTNRIFKCNKNGRNVHIYEVKGRGHRGVAVVEDEVMVCEDGNKGTVMVYNKELKYVRHIGGRNMGIFFDLSSDGHGSLFVTDYGKSCIRVFDISGVFLRFFGWHKDGVKKLNGPCFLSIAGRYVYVTNNGSVSVFTTEGEYVTSFGQRGNRGGEFNNPCGVCVDRDGYVCVSDQYNNRVQIF